MSWANVCGLSLLNYLRRVKPTRAETEADKLIQEAWDVDYAKHTLKLKDHLVRTGGAAVGEFHYGSS